MSHTPDRLEKPDPLIECDAKQILETLKNYGKVSRWKVYRLRREIKELLKLPEYFYLDNEIENLIESAKESL